MFYKNVNYHYHSLFPGPLHRFSSPHYPHEDRFNLWKSVLDADVKSKGNYYIYGNVRLCGRHFEQKYKTRGNRLTPNSEPTLNLCKYFCMFHSKYLQKRGKIGF